MENRVQNKVKYESQDLNGQEDVYVIHMKNSLNTSIKFMIETVTNLMFCQNVKQEQPERYALDQVEELIIQEIRQRKEYYQKVQRDRRKSLMLKYDEVVGIQEQNGGDRQNLINSTEKIDEHLIYNLKYFPPISTELPLKRYIEHWDEPIPSKFQKFTPISAPSKLTTKVHSEILYDSVSEQESISDSEGDSLCSEEPSEDDTTQPLSQHLTDYSSRITYLRVLSVNEKRRTMGEYILTPKDLKNFKAFYTY